MNYLLPACSLSPPESASQQPPTTAAPYLLDELPLPYIFHAIFLYDGILHSKVKLLELEPALLVLCTPSKPPPKFSPVSATVSGTAPVVAVGWRLRQ